MSRASAFCDECSNFRPYTGTIEETIPDDFTVCGLGHRDLKFQMPRSPIDNGWGFYRPSCPDRVTGFVPWRPGVSPSTLLAEVGLRFGE